MVFDLVKETDILVENFGPGVMKRLGLDYETIRRINQKKSYASISGFGQTGPYSQRPAYDMIAQGMGGVVSITGPEDPGAPAVRVGYSIGDMAAGLYGVIAIQAAYIESRKSGEGQWVDQGSTVVSRSVKSVTGEAKRISRKPGFNGIIYDIGGPTANMYGTTCTKAWDCASKRCLMPRPCPNLRFGHRSQLEVLNQVRCITGIKKVFVSTGIRPDLVMADKENAKRYIEQLVRYHVSGQIKLAPEHSEKEVLALMNKPSTWSLMKFREMFNNACAGQGKRYFMTYYLIAAHPGCTPEHNRRLKDFLSRGLKTTPEQIQIFTPTPSTLSTAMYYCETDLKGNPIFCEKSLSGMQEQKNILTGDTRHRSVTSNTPAKSPKTESRRKTGLKSKPPETTPRHKSGSPPKPRRSPQTFRGQKHN